MLYNLLLNILNMISVGVFWIWFSYVWKCMSLMWTTPVGRCRLMFFRFIEMEVYSRKKHNGKCRDLDKVLSFQILYQSSKFFIDDTYRNLPLKLYILRYVNKSCKPCKARKLNWIQPLCLNPEGPQCFLCKHHNLLPLPKYNLNMFFHFL